MKLHSINISNGGVPKRPQLACHVGFDGLEGDRQRDLRYHGGPDRAVCLYSLELIEALRAEGHDIEPGAIGENLTVKGVDWTLMKPGATLAVGPVRSSGDAVLECGRRRCERWRAGCAHSGEFVAAALVRWHRVRDTE